MIKLTIELLGLYAVATDTISFLSNITRLSICGVNLKRDDAECEVH